MDVSSATNDTYNIYLSIEGGAIAGGSLTGSYFFANTTFTTKSNGSSWVAPQYYFISLPPLPTTLPGGSLEVNQVLTNQVFSNSIAVNTELLAPTVFAGDISNNVATTAFVSTAIIPSLFYGIYNVVLSTKVKTRMDGEFFSLVFNSDANGYTYNISVQAPRTLLYVMPMIDIQAFPNPQAHPFVRASSFNKVPGFAVTFLIVVETQLPRK